MADEGSTRLQKARRAGFRMPRKRMTRTHRGCSKRPARFGALPLTPFPCLVQVSGFQIQMDPVRNEAEKFRMDIGSSPGRGWGSSDQTMSNHQEMISPIKVRQVGHRDEWGHDVVEDHRSGELDDVSGPQGRYGKHRHGTGDL